MKPYEILVSELLSILRRDGIDVSRLEIVPREGYIIVLGTVPSYYQLSLVQTRLQGNVLHGTGVEFNVSVAPGRAPTFESNNDASGEEKHQLRNRLNRLLLGVQLLHRAMRQNDTEWARQLLDRLVASEIDTSPRPTWDRIGLAAKRVFVLEDDLNQCVLLSGMLRYLGATVRHARSVESAEKHIRSDLHLDAMLIDIHLEHADGVEFARQVRYRWNWNNVKLIAISATKPEHCLAPSEINPFDLWLPKPINLSHLIDALLL